MTLQNESIHDLVQCNSCYYFPTPHFLNGGKSWFVMRFFPNSAKFDSPDYFSYLTKGYCEEGGKYTGA